MTCAIGDIIAGLNIIAGLFVQEAKTSASYQRWPFMRIRPHEKVEMPVMMILCNKSAVQMSNLQV